MNRQRVVGLWIVSILVFIGSIFASNWQYERHLQRSSLSEFVNQRLNGAVLDLSNQSSSLSNWQRVQIEGELSSAGPLIRSRPLDGRNGFWVTSTITTAQNNSYPVLLGWIPATSEATAIVSPPRITTDEVRLEGILRDLEQRQSASDLPAGQSLSMDRETLSTNQRFFIHSLTVTPEMQIPELRTVPIPNVSQGPHFFYAIQWLVFGFIAIFGTVWLIRSESKSNVKTKRS
jgi:cytochrome oxidase assembly protein ShyY1